jgi:hypothetical protein
LIEGLKRPSDAPIRRPSAGQCANQLPDYPITRLPNPSPFLDN